MQRFTFLSIFLFGIVTFSYLPALAQDNKEEKLEFSIVGKVTDAATGKPIEGVLVQLTGSDESSAEMTTKKNGKYVFDLKNKKGEMYVLLNIDYKVTVSKQGYQSASQEETTKGAEESIEFDLDFALEKAE